MPYLNLTTNVPIEDEKAFTLEFSKFGAETLSKPESYISVSYLYNPTLTFAGSHDPAFQLHITSLGNISPEANERYSPAFARFLKGKLGVSSDRGYIEFHDPGRENIGFKDTTFATIFGKK